MIASTSICLIWLLFVAVYDFRQRRVPNWLVLAGAVSALAMQALGNNPFEINWTSSLLGATAAFGCLLIFYALGFMGAGDVKFAGILGLWVGLTALLPIWLLSSILAAAHGMLWLVLQRRALFPQLSTLLFRPAELPAGTPVMGRTRFIPYAAYLALATLFWMSWGRQNF